MAALVNALSTRRRDHLPEGAGPTHCRPVHPLRKSTTTWDYIIGRRWDYLAWNTAADAVFAIADAAPPHARNVIWHFLTDPTARERFAHWEPMARGLTAELRAASARYPGDAWFAELIEDLKQASPDFGRWWPHHEASNHLDGPKIIEHPALGHLEFRHVTLQVFNDPDVRVTAHIPDAQTRTKLHRFRAK